MLAFESVFTLRKHYRAIADKPASRPKRLRTPKPSDDTGRRIIDAAIGLLEEGTAFHELRLSHAVERARQDEPDSPITRGAAYPRFPGGQSEFRLVVLAELLTRKSGQNRLKGAMAALDHLVEEMGSDDGPLSAAKLRTLIEEQATEQMRRIAADPSSTLRLYAAGILARDEEFPDRDALLEELRQTDAESARAWRAPLGVLAREYRLAPRKGFELEHFEIFLSALLTGLGVRRLVASDDERELLDALFPRLIAAAAFSGFFVEAPDRDDDVWAPVEELVDEARLKAPIRSGRVGASRRKRTTR